MNRSLMNGCTSAPAAFSRHGAAAVFFALLAAALIVFSGQLHSADEILMALTARSLATGFTLRFPETYGQTFTGYGVGTPIAGIPFYFLEAILRRGGIISQANDVSLLPLLNAVLFAVIGVLARGIVLGCAPAAPRAANLAVLVALCASPLLPASQTYYSDVLAAVGLLGLIWACLHVPGGRFAAWAFAFAVAAMLARVAMLPFLALVLVWEWRRGGGPSTTSVSGAAGIAFGLLVRTLQNWVLRGSPFAQGYEGQEFTTPLLAGLHGLLFSPERGLFVFYPAMVLVLLPRPCRRQGERSLWRLALTLLAFSLLFHGVFWTWHGGWTSGPRFLLPVIAVSIPVIASELVHWPALPRVRRVIAPCAIAWGMWGALLYSTFSPMAVWNDVWGFHQIESRWQFEPQLSLWQFWPALWSDGVRSPLLGIVSPVLLLLLLSLLLSLSPLRAATTRSHSFPRHMLPFCLSGLLLFGASCLLRGGRGVLVSSSASPTAEVSLPFARLELPAGSQPVLLQTNLDLRPHGSYGFHVKARGRYTVAFDGRTILQNDKTIAQHLAGTEVQLDESGLHLLEVRFQPEPDGGLLNLYWTWPGGGRLLAPLGGEYALPRTLSPVESAATFLWRRKILLLAGGLALVLLLYRKEGPKPVK
ncbi:hypothetical protein HZA57_08580 [Candidatus Poribacteria bacterium]|nr:hypothetical protein [Candidatus Poribacteria bacterium]